MRFKSRERKPSAIGLIVALPVLVGVSGVSIGCGIPGTTVVAELPRLPDRYGDDAARWEVTWWDGLTIRTVHVAGDQRVGAAPTGAAPTGATPTGATPTGNRPRRVSLDLAPVGAVLPVVVAVPHAGPDGSIPLAPFGGWTRGNGRDISLDRHGGEVGQVLLALVRAGVDPAVVNATRLYSLARQRLPDRPRRLDHDRLVDALLQQSMRSTYVAARFASLHQIRLTLDPHETGPVPWYTDDPMDRPVQPSPAGAYELFSIPVMEGEVRRLWRECPPGAAAGEAAEGEAAEGEAAGRCYQVLVVHRTPAGHGFHRVRTVTLSPRS